MTKDASGKKLTMIPLETRSPRGNGPGSAVEKEKVIKTAPLADGPVSSKERKRPTVGEVRELTAQRDYLQVEVDARVAEIRSLRARLDETEERKERVMNDSSTLRIENARLTGRVKKLEEDKGKLQSSLEVEKGIVSQVNTNLLDKITRIGVLETEVGTLDTRIKSLGVLVEERDAEIVRLTKELDVSRGKAEILAGSLKTGILGVIMIAVITIFSWMSSTLPKGPAPTPTATPTKSAVRATGSPQSIGTVFISPEQLTKQKLTDAAVDRLTNKVKNKDAKAILDLINALEPGKQTAAFQRLSEALLETEREGMPTDWAQVRRELKQ